jgi:hypothetical protein
VGGSPSNRCANRALFECHRTRHHPVNRTHGAAKLRTWRAPHSMKEWMDRGHSGGNPHSESDR